MSRFDLLISRDPAAPPHRDLGEVLVGQLGAEPVSLETLLREGRVLLRIGVDFAYASYCAKSLMTVGAVVELLPAVSQASVPAVSGRSLSVSAVPAVERSRPNSASSPNSQPAGRPRSSPNLTPPVTPAVARPAQLEHPAQLAQPAVPDPFAPADSGGSIDLALDLPPPRTASSDRGPGPGHGIDPPNLDGSGNAVQLGDDPPSLPRRSGSYTASRPSSAASSRGARSGSFPSARNAVRTCPRCGTLLAGTDECPRCAEGDVAPPPPQASLRARIRENPPLRYAAGFALALSLGFFAQAPYARRQEARVVELRAKANKDRYRPDPTVQAQSRALDAEADDTAQHAALVTGGIWLLVAAAVFGAWYFLL